MSDISQRQQVIVRFDPGELARIDRHVVECSSFGSRQEAVVAVMLHWCEQREARGGGVA